MLPTSLSVGGVEREIRSDYRDCLNILVACNDAELNAYEKMAVMLEILYKDYADIEEKDMQEAVDKAVWFLDCGSTATDSRTKRDRVYDWEQDEQIIFAAINKVAGHEVRAVEYVHWWTFISYFHEIGEGLFSTVVHIRDKKNKKKKLEKYEAEFYKENKSLVDLKKKYSEEQLAEIDRINKILQ